MEQLYTRWGKNLDCHHVLQEYPRPLLQRESYINLNGYWEYAITKAFKRPKKYDGRILVPFSPESVLSGVGRQLMPDEYLWYRTRLSVDFAKMRDGLRLILHFGAVDQACRVYVNGREAARHTGGYLPFSVDITEYCLYAEKRQEDTPEQLEPPELVVAVRDVSDTSYHTRGKQKLKRGGMFYTAQSGIWQTVWMEYVPDCYIEGIETEPVLEYAQGIAHGKVRICVRAGADRPVLLKIKEPALYQEATERLDKERVGIGREKTASADGLKWEAAMENVAVITQAKGMSNQEIEITLPNVRPWTCEEPYLYYVVATMGEDEATSYFALRTFSVEKDGEGIPRICLNGEVQFQNGVLDQGYWPDGLYTAPSDEALIFDITEMKKMGFNMLRKHIKIEPDRWYYHCDRLGMVVWQDMVNGGTYYKHWFVTYAATLFSRKRWLLQDNCLPLLSRAHREGRAEFVREMKETIRLLRGHPSIAAWVIFNEGWGQFHAKKMTQIARACDSTRLIDEASGWFDQSGGDMQSIHHYFFNLKFAPEKTRVTVVSEFGGYSLRIPGHSAYEKLYGYGIHKNLKDLNAAYRERMRKMEEQIADGLCACVYTQLSDVEEEVNGIFTYDREIKKIEKYPSLI